MWVLGGSYEIVLDACIWLYYRGIVGEFWEFWEFWEWLYVYIHFKQSSLRSVIF